MDPTPRQNPFASWFLWPFRAGTTGRPAVTQPDARSLPAARFAALGGALVLLLFLYQPARAQQHEVSGTVTSAETGEPLPGANVVVEGTSIGTLTDAQGGYTLNAPSASGTLVFSLIGFAEREVEIAGQSVIDVALAPSAVALEEIVVLGYSERAESQVTSSVEQIDAEELEGVTTENVSTMLQGKAAGVYVTNGSGMPGDAPQVRIRGTGSITAISEPLYVVDGVIADASMAQFIPAGNIASVTVLKDAAATALYGSRAANGVLVITTKTGQAGETQVQVNSSVGYNYPIFGNFELMNSRQLYEMQQSMGVPNLTEDLLSRNTDWRDVAFRQGLTTNLNMSAAGGDEQTTFFVSGGYYDEEGTLVSTGYDRISGRVNLNHDANDRFQITARAYGRYETRLSNPSGALYGAYTYLPWDVPYNEDGTLKTGREPEWRGRDQSNFLYPLQYNWSDGRFQDFGGDLKLAYDLTPWLSFSTTNRAEFEYDHYESYSDLRYLGGQRERRRAEQHQQLQQLGSDVQPAPGRPGFRGAPRGRAGRLRVPAELLRRRVRAGDRHLSRPGRPGRHRRTVRRERREV